MQTLHFMAFIKPEKMTSCKGYFLMSDTGNLLDVSLGVQTILGVGLDEVSRDKTVNNWVGVVY